MRIKGKLTTVVLVVAALFASAFSLQAWDWTRVLSAGVKAVQAGTISDSQVQNYVHEYVQYMDKKNKVSPEGSKYAVRLEKLSSGLTDVDGIPLNFKVYHTSDVNAFACADGSVRVFSGLMDLMNDDEVLGVIGHEIGHVAHKDTKRAFKNALLTSAFMDGIASTGNVAAALTDSQLGQLGQAIEQSHYSQKQESQADEYGYKFLKDHGKNPLAMAMAFEKLKSLEGSDPQGPVSQLFSSHPSTDKRIKNILKWAKRDGYTMPDTQSTSSSSN